MDQLREQLEFKSAKWGYLTKYPSDRIKSISVFVRAELTPLLAETLKCRNQIFDLNDNLYEFSGAIGLPHSITDCDVILPNGKWVNPTGIQKFKVGLQSNDHSKAEVSFIMRFNNQWKELNDAFDNAGQNAFPLTLKARQLNLFDVQETKTDGPAGGTRVDVRSGSVEESPDEQPSEDDGQQLAMVDAKGNAIPLPDDGWEEGYPQPRAEENGAAASTLASAREVAGGTTDAARKAKGKRRIVSAGQGN